MVYILLHKKGHRIHIAVTKRDNRDFSTKPTGKISSNYITKQIRNRKSITIILYQIPYNLEMKNKPYPIFLI